VAVALNLRCMAHHHALTKKTQEAAGFSFSAITNYLISSCVEVGKTPENPRFSWLLPPRQSPEGHIPDFLLYWPLILTATESGKVEHSGEKVFQLPIVNC